MSAMTPVSTLASSSELRTEAGRRAFPWRKAGFCSLRRPVALATAEDIHSAPQPSTATRAEARPASCAVVKKSMTLITWPMIARRNDDAHRRLRYSPLSQGCSRVRSAVFKASMTHPVRGSV